MAEGETGKKSIVHYLNKIDAVVKAETEKGEEVKRYAFYPILNEKSFEFYTKQEIAHWIASELSFVDDVKHYDGATPQVRKIIDTILAFFLSGDGAITENIVWRFLMECKSYEEKAFFISQLHIELVHAETYGLSALTFKKEPQAMGSLIESLNNTSCVRKKMDFMQRWMLADVPRYQRLVAFACAEGVFFCTLFAVIFWFRSKGQFPNFIFANELIAKDESLHRDFACHLYGEETASLENKEEISEITLKIVQEAVEIEDEFVDYILDEPLEDLNAVDMKTYCRLISDNLLIQLGFKPVYRVKNPFTWLNDISLQVKSNFFEVRVGSYVKKSLSDVLNWRKRAGLKGTEDVAYTNPEEVDF